MYHSIKESLNQYLDLYRLQSRVTNATLELVWEKAVGKTIAGQTKILKRFRHTLTVKVTNPVWRTELGLQKQEIIDKLNEQQNRVEIRDIRFI